MIRAASNYLRSLVALATGAALLVVTSSAGWGAETKAPRGHSIGEFKHEGTVVAAKDGLLAMTIADRLPHTHPVAPDAKIKLDGKPAKLSDLKKGDRVHVVSKVKITPHPAGHLALSIEGPALEIEATRPKRPNDTAGAKKEVKDVALGVAVAPSPGGSPLVLGIAKDSPAQAAGIQRGDYITAVDKKKLDSPEALQTAIEKKRPGDTAELGVWRNGEQLSVEVKFPPAQGADSPKLAATPWLGLMLEAAGEKSGASIARVYLHGPAAKADLRRGDRIVEIDGKPVKSPRDAAQRVRQLEPGEETEIAVVRDGDRKQVTVQVGNLGDFHERLFGKNFRERFEDFHKLFDPDFDGVPQRLELLRPRLPDDSQ